MQLNTMSQLETATYIETAKNLTQHKAARYSHLQLDTAKHNQTKLSIAKLDKLYAARHRQTRLGTDNYNLTLPDTGRHNEA